MGRTIPPYSFLLEHFRDRLKAFKKSLRKEDKQRFDVLMRYAKYHVQTGVLSAFPNPSDPVFLSIALELLKKSEELEKKNENLKKEIQELKLSIGFMKTEEQ